MQDLPEPQLYIILGIVATTCAIVSARVTQQRKPPFRFKWAVLCLFFVSVLSAVPIWFELHDVMKPLTTQTDAPFWKNLLFWKFTMHLAATFMLFLMATIWYGGLAIRRQYGFASEDP